MKPTLLATAVVVVSAYAPAAQATIVERACNASDRKAATRTMCGCIQDAADMMLSSRDQRRAAELFSDPHASQELRQSDRYSDEKFWIRYKEFGNVAAKFCSG
jgi:hypothetical protein